MVKTLPGRRNRYDEVTLAYPSWKRWVGVFRENVAQMVVCGEIRVGEIFFAHFSLTVNEIQRVTMTQSSYVVSSLCAASLRVFSFMRSHLRSAELSFADRSYAERRYAELRFAELRSVERRFAELRSAELRFAEIR